MTMNKKYMKRVNLLVQLLPCIAKEKVFALKGGTAINLFYRDMQRLSVDIDLTYMPVADREFSLKDIDETFNRILKNIRDAGYISSGRNLEGKGKKKQVFWWGRATSKCKLKPHMSFEARCFQHG